MKVNLGSTIKYNTLRDLDIGDTFRIAIIVDYEGPEGPRIWPCTCIQKITDIYFNEGTQTSETEIIKKCKRCKESIYYSSYTTDVWLWYHMGSIVRIYS